MKRIIFINIALLLIIAPSLAQTGKQSLNREVTLFNPYKPSLSDARKKSFLPDLNDTSRVRPDFRYNIVPVPYAPEYAVSPIKAASLVPEALEKLYKSYVKLGFGNYVTPLLEVSVTNERSKKGAVGLMARHYSSNGWLKLDNNDKAFAGYMDNDLSLFGKKFFRGNYLDGSLDFVQKVRYAYGYDTSIVGYNPSKKEIRMPYQNAGAHVSFGSLNLDSASFSYDFDLSYNIFFTTQSHYQHNIGLTGTMATMYKGFYAGSDIEIQYYKPSSAVYPESKYIASLSPFVMKSSQLWSFKAGLELLLDRNLTNAPKFHVYPDVKFSFSVIPSYVSFFAALNGNLIKNDPLHVVDINPYLVSDTIFKLVNTSNALSVSAGLKGNTGIGGNYLLSASYSFMNDMLMFENAVYPLNTPALMGNTFYPITDDAEVFRLHGEIDGPINRLISYRLVANLYNYTLSHYNKPFNLPQWDLKAGAAYNLRDKILGTTELTVTGKRYFAATSSGVFEPNIPVDSPAHVNLNIGAEYRYSKILSFWLKLNNISNKRYYEWAWYPSQRFLLMAGFTYSL